MKFSSLARSMFVILLFTTAGCFAQFSSNVSGTVKDASGAVVPNVTVLLHNIDTGADFRQTTNATGFYRFSAIAPGNYEVKTAAPNSKPTSETVSLSTDETRGLDVTLLPGTSTDVSVNTVASSLNPEETRLQTTIGTSEITRLPLPNRDVQLLISLTPGVTGYQNESPSNGYGSSIFAGSFNPPYHANGLGTNGNLFLIDDLPVNDAQTQGNALLFPNSEMIQQVSLQTQTYSVENGTGASIQTAFTTKSGTNRVHGSIDYGYDSSNIAAAYPAPVTIAAPGTKPIKPQFHQNILLASMGGPIYRDRSFFFGSIEKQNSSIAGNSATTPYFTPAFAQWAVQAFPNSGAAKGLVFAPPTRDVGGTVKYASDYYPSTCGKPQTTNGLPYTLPCNTPVYVVGATFNQGQPFNGIQWNVRLDQTFRDGKDRLYGMYERIDQKLGNLAERPALDGVTPSQNKYFSVNYVHVFSDRLLNEAHFGNVRVISGSQLGDVRATSIPYLPILLDTAAGFQFTFPFGNTPFAAQTNKEHTYAIRDTVSYTLGRHSLRAGYQYYRGDVFQDSSTIYTRPFVPFYFADTFSWVSNTAQASYNLYTIGGDGKYRPQLYGASSTFNGFFAEDSWKARQNLTLSFGLRYDNFGNPSPYGSTAGPFVPLTPGSGPTFADQAIATTTKITTSAFPGSMNTNVAPRVGFAYTPLKNNQTLIRGGIGLYYNALTPFQIAGNLPTQPPNRISLNPFGVVPYGDFSTVAPPYGYNYNLPTYGVAPWGNVYSNAAQSAVYPSNISGYAPDVKPEKSLNYSLALEQQFPASIVLGINYAGSHGYDLIYGGQNSNYNLKGPGAGAVPATTNWGVINYNRNGLVSNYNALVVTLRQTHGNLTYQANYNWSHALQDAPQTSDAQGSQWIWDSVTNPKTYYGPASFDQTNTFNLAGEYEVPKLFEAATLNQIATGWRLSTIVIAQSGTPFSVVTTNGRGDGTDVALSGDYLNDGSGKLGGSSRQNPSLPNYRGTRRTGFSRSVALTGAFTASQFSVPAGYTAGPVHSSQGANTFRNYGYFTVNAGVSKAFSLKVPRLAEGVKIALRGEAVNLLNRTNYGGFSSDLSNSGNFGKITTANQKRYLQIGGRLEF